jgi:hypothetical protein
LILYLYRRRLAHFINQVICFIAAPSCGAQLPSRVDTFVSACRILRVGRHRRGRVRFMTEYVFGFMTKCVFACCVLILLSNAKFFTHCSTFAHSRVLFLAVAQRCGPRTCAF